MVVRPVRFNTSSLVIFCCHETLRMRRRYRRWRVLVFFSCTLDNVNVSQPYSRVLHTQERWTLAFVRMLNFGLSQTLAVNRAKVPDALPMQLFFLSNDAFYATFEPRYTNSSTISIFLQLILIDGKIFVFWLKTWIRTYFKNNKICISKRNERWILIQCIYSLIAFQRKFLSTTTLILWLSL